MTIPTPDATLAWSSIGYTLPGSDGLVGSGLASYTFIGLYTAQLGPTAPGPGFTSWISGSGQLPAATASSSTARTSTTWRGRARARSAPDSSAR